jgi:cell division septation protein DedD
MIGPFNELISANQVRARLKALDITVNTYQVSIPDKPDYWVHLGPMRSRKEALDLLRELQAKNIDSFLITEGELVNGISLGFFSREELAQGVMKQRREIGYEAKIRKVPRFSREIWEVFAGDEHLKLSDQLWQQIKAGTQDLELRKNSCELIASAEKLD